MINLKTLVKTMKYIYIYVGSINFIKYLITSIILYEIRNHIELFSNIFNIIINKKHKLIKTVYNTIIIYILKKYILNCLFPELCLYYIPNLNITNLKLYIKNKISIHNLEQIFIVLKILLIIYCTQQKKFYFIKLFLKQIKIIIQKFIYCIFEILFYILETLKIDSLPYK